MSIAGDIDADRLIRAVRPEVDPGARLMAATQRMPVAADRLDTPGAAAECVQDAVRRSLRDREREPVDAESCFDHEREAITEL